MPANGTFEAQRRRGETSVDVRVVAGLSDQQYQELALALNKLPEGSNWDDDVLGELLGELDQAGADLEAIGFTEREIAKRLGESDEIEVREIETGDVDDEFWISVRGPLARQAEALQALERAMKPLPDVTVELGTINFG